MRNGGDLGDSIIRRRTRRQAGSAAMKALAARSRVFGVMQPRGSLPHSHNLPPRCLRVAHHLLRAGLFAIQDLVDTRQRGAHDGITHGHSMWVPVLRAAAHRPAQRFNGTPRRRPRRRRTVNDSFRAIGATSQVKLSGPSVAPSDRALFGLAR